MLAGAGDDGYLHAMRRIIIPALEKFEPELIIVACGYDANAIRWRACSCTATASAP